MRYRAAAAASSSASVCRGGVEGVRDGKNDEFGIEKVKRSHLDKRPRTCNTMRYIFSVNV